MQILTDNPLTEFVELPDEYRPLRYSNLLPGVIRGALEMVSPLINQLCCVLWLLCPGFVVCLSFGSCAGILMEAACICG